MKAVRDVDEIKAEIRAAHERGDQAELRALQKAFRHGGFAIRRTLGPGSVTIRDGGEPRSSSRATSGASARSTPKVNGGAGVRVVITRGAYEDLLEYHEIGDGLEASGGLFGFAADGELVVERCTVTRNTRRTRNSVEVDDERLETEERHFRGAGWTLLGDWHTHPDPGLASSAQDRRSWLGSANHRSHDWLGLILDSTTDWFTGTDWSKPAVRAFVARPGSDEIRVAGVVLGTRSAT